MKKTVLCAVPVLAAALLCSCFTATPQPDTTESSSAAETEVSLAAVQPQTDAEYYELIPYTKKGTGPEKPAEIVEPDCYYSRYIKLDDNKHITTLTDKDLEQKINARIDEKLAIVSAQMNAFNEKEKDNPYIPEEAYINSYARCFNGYLLVKLPVEYFYYNDETKVEVDYTCCCESLIFDIYTGKELDISDVFYKDTDYISYYNSVVEEDISKPLQLSAFDTVVIPQKREFSGITED